MTKSFWSTMQRELLDRRQWSTLAELGAAIFEWIEGFNIPRRRHSTLGYRSPAEYNTSHRRPHRGMITTPDVSGKPGQAPCPWQNGKVERLNRTLATEWAYRQPWTSNDQRTAALAGWLEHYNTQRRLSALGGQAPIKRLAPT